MTYLDAVARVYVHVEETRSAPQIPGVHSLPIVFGFEKTTVPQCPLLESRDPRFVICYLHGPVAVDSKLGQVQLERERGRWTQHAGQSKRETSSPDGQRWVLQVSGKYPQVAQPSMSCAQGPEGGHHQSQKERGAQLPLQPAPRRLDILKKVLLRQMARSKVSSAGPAGVLRGCPRMVTASHLPQPAVDRQGKDPVEESPFHILPLQWQTNRTTRRVPSTSTSGSPSRRTTKTHKNQKRNSPDILSPPGDPRRGFQLGARRHRPGRARSCSSSSLDAAARCRRRGSRKKRPGSEDPRRNKGGAAGDRSGEQPHGIRRKENMLGRGYLKF